MISDKQRFLNLLLLFEQNVKKSFFVNPFQSMGYPVIDANGKIIDINSNLKCANPSCTKHLWNETALTLASKDKFRPVSKNTLLLPAQGYVIVRFLADNPGYWPLHCHNLMHNLEGMAVLLHVKDSINNRPFSNIPDG